eukprot:gene9921-17359_t
MAMAAIAALAEQAGVELPTWPATLLQQGWPVVEPPVDPENPKLSWDDDQLRSLSVTAAVMRWQQYAARHASSGRSLHDAEGRRRCDGIPVRPGGASATDAW